MYEIWDCIHKHIKFVKLFLFFSHTHWFSNVLPKPKSLENSS